MQALFFFPQVTLSSPVTADGRCSPHPYPVGDSSLSVLIPVLVGTLANITSDMVAIVMTSVHRVLPSWRRCAWEDMRFVRTQCHYTWPGTVLEVLRVTACVTVCRASTVTLNIASATLPPLYWTAQYKLMCSKLTTNPPSTVPGIAATQPPLSPDWCLLWSCLWQSPAVWQP